MNFITILKTNKMNKFDKENIYTHTHTYLDSKIVYLIMIELLNFSKLKIKVESKFLTDLFTIK